MRLLSSKPFRYGPKSFTIVVNMFQPYWPLNWSCWQPGQNYASVHGVTVVRYYYYLFIEMLGNGESSRERVVIGRYHSLTVDDFLFGHFFCGHTHSKLCCWPHPNYYSYWYVCQGSHVEIFYALLSFGIPVGSIPVNSNSPHWEFDMAPHRAWIESRRQKERLLRGQSSSSLMLLQPSSSFSEQRRKASTIPFTTDTTTTTTSNGLKVPGSGTTGDAGAIAFWRRLNQQKSSSSGSSITSSGDTSGGGGGGGGAGDEEEVTPQPQDVLLGKLRVAKGQLGYDRLGALIDELRPEYERCSTKMDKMKISQRIVEQIKSQGGRFLKQTKYKYGKDRRVENNESSIGWVQVTDSIAREKISHTFRNLRLRQPLHQLTRTTSITSTTPSDTSDTEATTTRTVSSSAAALEQMSSSRNMATSTTTTTTTADRAGSRSTDDSHAIGTASVLSCKIPPAGCFWQSGER
jgi:hypothetical protein